MPNNIYDALHSKYVVYSKNRASAKIVESATRWFVSEVLKTVGSSKVSLRLAEEGTIRIPKNAFQLGKMYIFEYQASLDEEYYDRFPLVIPFTKENDRIYGFNLHYLPIRYRVKAMVEILKKATTDNKYPPKREATTRVDYTRVNGGQFNFMKVAVRSYLFKRIKTKPAEIPATGWLSAAFLPTADYKGNQISRITQSKVTAEMLKKIRNL